MDARLLRHIVKSTPGDGAPNVVGSEVTVDLDDITTILIASTKGSSRVPFVRSLLDRFPSAMVYWFEASSAETRALRRLFDDSSNVLVVNNRIGAEDDFRAETVSVDGLRLTTLDVLAIFTDDEDADVIAGATDTLTRFSTWIVGDTRRVDDVMETFRGIDANARVVDSDASLFIAGAFRRREGCPRSSSALVSPC